MASAKPKFRAPEESAIVSLIEIKAKREQEAKLARLALEEQRRAANEAVRNGNVALRKLRGHDSEVIIDRICRATKVSRKDLMSDKRKNQIAFARQAAMYWLCRLTDRSLPEVGRMLGGKDHTTCLWGARIYPAKRAKMGRYLREARASQTTGR